MRDMKGYEKYQITILIIYYISLDGFGNHLKNPYTSDY